jgi:hypothetical protein
MVLLAFVGFTLMGQLLNVFLCLWLDVLFSPTVGSLTFVVLYALVFVAAYKLALFFFDREEPQAARTRSADKRLRSQPARDDAWRHARTQAK